MSDKMKEMMMMVEVQGRRNNNAAAPRTFVDGWRGKRMRRWAIERQRLEKTVCVMNARRG